MVMLLCLLSVFAYSVRRSELYSRAREEDDETSEDGVDALLEAQLRERLVGIYGDFDLDLDVRPQQGEKGVHDNDREEGAHEEEAEQEFEFRLFSGQGGAGKKIVLSNEEEDTGDGAFLVKQRRLGYYIAEKADGERKREFEVAALSGENVLRMQRSRAWGLEVPWRIKVIKVSSKRKVNTVDGVEKENLVFGITDEDEEGKRKRPGKKRRIVLRERQKKRDALAARRKKEKDEKEAEREKRTRKNRERKIKRRLKDKAKKAGEGANVIMDDGESSPLKTAVDAEKTANG